MSYKQLIAGQRYQIEAYLREGFSYREIGKRLKVSHSTISREIRRNRIRENHYLPEVAQAKTLKRRVQAAKSCLSKLTITFVEFGLKQKWSPEQIAGVGRIIGLSVSHAWIYGYVQRDKLSGGKLFRHLRQGHRRYRNPTSHHRRRTWTALGRPLYRQPLGIQCVRRHGRRDVRCRNRNRPNVQRRHPGLRQQIRRQ